MKQILDKEPGYKKYQKRERYQKYQREKVRDKREKGYHKLLIWQRLKEFIKLVYLLTDKLPKSEEFGLKPQMRRAIVSVISNFVEGYLKISKKHKKSYLEITKTSLLELEAQGEICRILDYWSEEEYDLFDGKRGEIAFLLFRYTASLK